ncbi:MAG TPA: hypothetical protein VLA52_03910 [Thermohalobaculum sp.]|nr:hypothetical protein [Thermohalobaculum sp.]
MPRSSLFAALLAALLTAAPAAADESAPAPEAVTFVAGFADDLFAGMLARYGMQAPQLAALAEVHGDEAVAPIFQSEIVRAVREHGPVWRHNLALAWTPLLTAEELRSLTLSGSASPHLEKYMGLRADAGSAMQALSGDLLQTALRDAVEGTVARFPAQ